ncbi:ABC transporter substrate-binding protein [Propionicicella superfundia]|uniref:ABC transporter substrate-binding protein n=1 Tax=Propionicicella superfundia TaxID=348582 RepID=UPI000405D183|nr:ABC transporter substrate-binding protein [Propionicicella superfundia]
MSKLKVLCVTLAVLFLGACAAPGGAATTTAAPSTTVGLTYIPNVQFAPFYAAESQGYFTASGASVTLRHHGSNEGLFTALLAGEEDFVLAGAGEMMQARAEGADLIAIASYYREYPVRIIVPASSAYRTAADLKGKRIGVPGRYGESWFGLQAFLKAGDLSESDVEIVEIGYTQQAALTTGKVDAVVGYVNNDAVSFELAGFAVRSLPVADDVPLVSASLVTTRSYATAHPEIARAVVAGMLRGITFATTETDKTLDISATFVPNLTGDEARASAKATLSATASLLTADGGPTGELDEAQFREMASFLYAQGIISTEVDGAQAMTNAYVG